MIKLAKIAEEFTSNPKETPVISFGNEKRKTSTMPSLQMQDMAAMSESEDQYQVIFQDDYSEVPYTKKNFSSEEEADEWVSSMHQSYEDEVYDPTIGDYTFQTIHKYYNPEDKEMYDGYEIRNISQTLEEGLCKECGGEMTGGYCSQCGEEPQSGDGVWGNPTEDHESMMARGELKDMISNASKIYNMIEPGTELPGWVSAYITLASDYMHSVAEYAAENAKQ